MFESYTARAEALVWMCGARWLSTQHPPEVMVARARTAARWFEDLGVPFTASTALLNAASAQDALAALAARAHDASWWASRVMPEADCVDRAITARWWLALRGVDASVILGMRRNRSADASTPWEGHAWLDARVMGAHKVLFYDARSSYKQVWREQPRRGAPLTRTPLAAALWRHVLDGATPQDVARVQARAASCGLDALLRRQGPPVWREVLASHPESAAARRGHLADVVLRRRALRQVVDILESAEVDVLVLKGEPLAQRIFGDGLARRSSDVDILVPPAQVERAGEVLMAHNYAPHHAPYPEPARYNQWALYHTETGRLVEIHWSLSAPGVPSPAAEDLFADSVLIPFHDAGVRVLSPAHTLMHLCLHFHNHTGFLKGLFDIAGWLDSSEREALDDALAQARTLGMNQVMVWPLMAIVRIAHLCDPSIHRAARDARRASLAARWTAHVSRGVFAREQPVEDGDALGFKIQGITQTEATAWRLLGRLLLDDPQAVAREWLRAVASNPQEIAQARGRNEAEWRDVVTWAGRTRELCVRVWRDFTA